MFEWISRLLSPPVPPARAASQGTSPDAPAKSAAGAAPAATASAFGIRQPLIGAQGGVAGFEFLLPTGLQRRLAARGDLAALAAHQSLLLVAMKPVTAAGRVALTRLSAAVLGRPGVAEQAGAGSLLLVSDLAHLAPEAAKTLRARGLRLGVEDCPPQAAPKADFVLMQGGKGGVDTLLLSAQRWQDARPRLPLVATGLAGVDEMERLLQAGFWLVGGELGRSAAAASRPLNAAAHHICGLINHLALNHDTSVLAEALRSDVALSYRLLRFANSPAMGLPRGVDSVEQAVLLLGRKELTRWLSVMLLSASGDRVLSAALQEQALARGRLLELLGRAEGLDAPEALFSLGMFSMLEVLLQVPLADTLEPLRLGEPALQALLAGQGPWSEHLALAVALGANDESAVERLAGRWGGPESVQAMAEEAWSWAAGLRGADATS